MGLPIGSESMTLLSQAIEERLSKFIKLKQFHFRFTKYEEEKILFVLFF